MIPEHSTPAAVVTNWSPVVSGRRSTCLLVALSLLVQLPFLNRGLSLLDEGSVVAIAEGLRNGEALYRDRVTPVAPLTYELMAGLFRLFGPHILVGRILELCVFTVCIIFLYAILVRSLPQRWAFAGALALLPVKALGFPLWTIVNYSQLAMLFCLGTVWLLLRAQAIRNLSTFFAVGLGVGLTAITKQNLGAYLGLTVAAGIGLDALRDRDATRPSFWMSGFVTLGGAMVPLAITVVLFVAQGTLGDAVTRAVLGLRDFARPYYVGMPYVGPWALDSTDFAVQAFTYFPAPITHLWLEGVVDLRSPTVGHTIEFVVKAAYYIPLIAIMLVTGGLGWAFRSKLARTEWNGTTIVVAFAVAAYASMMYRADWIHLMNISPPLVMVCVTALSRLAARGRVLRGGAVAIVSAWFLTGSAVAAVVLEAYRVPVETARGTLRASPAEASEANRLLAYVDKVPARERIAFLSTEPLYYFLSGRRIPLTFDLVMEGICGPADDEKLARQLERTDRVIFNPKRLPTAASPLTRYAPRAAAVLATRFEIVEVLGPTAAVLQRGSDDRSRGETVVDLWRRFSEIRPVGAVEYRGSGRPPARRRRVEPTTWLVYRTITATVMGRRTETCFEFDHLVRGIEAISTRPMFHPDSWTKKSGGFDARRARFTIGVAREPGGFEPIYSAVRSASVVPGPILVRLDAYAGRRVTLRFCAALPGSVPPRAGYAAAGWGELAIVRLSS